MAVCEGDTSPAGVRDAAIVGLFWVGGLGRTIVASLELADHDQEAFRLTVRGKWNKTQAFSIEESGALVDWLHLRGAGRVRSSHGSIGKPAATMRSVWTGSPIRVSTTSWNSAGSRQGLSPSRPKICGERSPGIYWMPV